MTELIGSARYCIYRGHQYVVRWSGFDRDFGVDAVIIVRPEGDSMSDYPDVLQSGAKKIAPWVEVPKSVLSRLWREDVHGEWHGVRFTLHVVGRDPDMYSGYTSDPLAGDLGMRGSQYDGWEGLIPAAEVHLVDRVVGEYPLSVPSADYSAKNVIKTVIPFTDEKGGM